MASETEVRQFHIHGTVIGIDGRALSRATVIIYWQHIRKRVEVAKGKTNEDGRYSLTFHAPENFTADVLVVVVAESEQLEAALESQLTTAQADTQIDLAAQPHDQSEFTSLVRAIEPLLEGLRLDDIEESEQHQDISFLSRELKKSPEDIMRVAVADRLEDTFDVPTAVFYAFLRQHVPSALPSPLLEASQGFTMIDALVRRIGSLIFALTPELQQSTIEAAIKQNLISTDFSKQVPELVERLQKLRTTDALGQPYNVGKTTLGQLLDAAQLPKTKQDALATALLANIKPMKDFWKTLADGQHGFTPEEVTAVRRTLEVGVIVKNFLPLTQTLLQGFSSGTYSSLHDLARLSLKDWEDLVKQTGPPPNIDAAGNVTPAEVYARVVYTRVTRAYPTAALSGRINTGNFISSPERAPLTRFFANNPTLELARTNVEAYLGQQGDKAMAGIEPKDRPAVIQNAKRFQRILRVLPAVDSAQTLLSLGIHSATQIATMGRQQFFVKATQAGLTKRAANRAYEVGAHRYASVVSMMTQYNRDVIGIWPRAIGSTNDMDQPTANAIQRNQSLATLFGSQDFCQVDSCTSVLSPAAYVCDLLLWLRNHPLTGPFPNALRALFDRRPDLGHLLLNCPNTETPLPYIDLVNELLEDAVSPPGSPVWKQTTLSAAELRAAPEHVNTAAYTVLAGASYPHTLPYDSPLDELRTYLQQAGVALWQLRQALLPLHSPSVGQQASVAAERLQIDPHEFDLITNANFVALAVAWNTPTPVTDLAPIPAFLQAASITYEQLLELLAVLWTRGGGAPTTIQGIDDTCDTSIQSLSPLDATRLDLMHRFLRLWRHGIWKMWELDLLMRAPLVGNGTLDNNALVALFTFRTLQETTHLSTDQQLAFFQNIDTGSHRDPDGSQTTSLYARLFLDPAVPADPDLTALATGGPIADPNLSDHVPAIQAALQISSVDATTLFGLTNGQLTLSNLSFLYRVITLARTVRLSLTDLQRVTPLTSAGSLTAALASPSATLAFIQQVKSIAQSGFSIDALIYVLTTQPTTVGITQNQITTAVMPAVRTAMQQTWNEIFASADPKPTILGHELAQIPQFADPTTLGTAMSIVLDTFTGTLTDRNNFIAANFGIFMDVPTAQTDLAPLPPGLTPAQLHAAVDLRCQEVLNPLFIYLTQTRVIAALASNLQLQNDVTALLVQQLQVPGTASTLLTVLTDPSIIAKTGTNYTFDITPANFPNQYLAIQLLDKVGTVVRQLHLVKSDLSWLLTNAAIYGGLDLTQLPVLMVQPALTIAALLTTSLVVKLDRAFSAAPPGAPVPDLYTLILNVSTGAIATEAAAQAALATITGWSTTDIAALSTAIGLVFSGDYTQPSTYLALHTLVTMLSATHGSGAQLVSWGVAAPDASTAASAQGVLKSQYSNDAWLQIAPKMMNPIRDRRSAALQAYLVSQRDMSGKLIYGDTNALFDHFLIDVQMTSCEVTTRVVQAYAAIQLFVERCFMGLEEPNVVVDLTHDDTWGQWKWMKRYRLWEANRKVFLYPENWMIESQRPNRTEIFQKLEQEVHQNESTADYLETVALNYIDRLDDVAHLIVTGTCTDPATGAIHVVARSQAEPPRFYLRTLHNGEWSGWQQIPLDIKAHQVVPAIYRRRLCLFWLDVKVSNEPHQQLPAPQASSSAPNQDVARYVSITVNFSIFRNDAWSPTQHAKGKLFDIPVPLFGGLPHPTTTVGDSKSLETFYTIKVQAPAPSPGYGATLFVDVFRLGVLQTHEFFDVNIVDGVDGAHAVHLGRAIFDGRFSDLELRNLLVQDNFLDFIGVMVPLADGLLTHAQTTYGPDAQPLLPLPDAQADPSLTGEPGLIPQAGALTTLPRGPSDPATIPLTFTSINALEQSVGPLLNTASVPFRVVGPVTDLSFDPSSYFFYQDTRRCYYVESVRYYQSGSTWTTTPPSNVDTAPFQVRYRFHRFYHPYTRLFWHQLSGGGFPLLYDRNLQLHPDTIDPSGADVFSFQSTYNPITPRVAWGEDNEIIDFGPEAANNFTPSAPFLVYNWELFVHTPLYIAELLSQNQQFEDALKWFHFIFDPTRQGPDPIPQRYWIPKPLYNLTSSQIMSERINQLLLLVNQGDANAIAQVTRWRKDPFNPFLLADQRPVAYMKRVVMSYLDNLIAWADNLFSTDSRENLNEATLLYVIAAEILGPQPVAITPPQHADASYDDLEPKLDAFANAMVDIENVIGGGGMGGGGGMPAPQTFYFKIPPNDKLLGYWTTVADRLFKLRHCQNIAGVTRQLALFDAPIDPGLLIKAQAAGVDIGSVLNDTQAPLPNYRFTVLYAQALDFVNAVRSYGASLLAAIGQRDAAQLAMLMTTTQQQLLKDADQIYALRVQQAQNAIDTLNQAMALVQSRFNFNDSQPFKNSAEEVSTDLNIGMITLKAVEALAYTIAGIVYGIPDFLIGVAGFGGSPTAGGTEGGQNIGNGVKAGAQAAQAASAAIEISARLAATIGGYSHRMDNWKQAAAEAQIEMQQITSQIAGAQLALQIATLEQSNHQEQIDNLQQQIDFLTNKFTNQDLYDWMVSQLSTTYFQSYRLAYKICKQAERCYRYELGLPDSSFIEFGYWDSLKKGLLAGETMNHDLRSMQASYLEQNSRRYELSRYISLAATNPVAMLTLLEKGSCDFDLLESLFDHDYPGHFQRHLVRVSLTLVYPNPSRFDNVKGTLTLMKNSVRTSTDLGAGYPRQGPNDPRFVDQYAAVGQRIALSNAQDDPGLFINAIAANINDPRYLPFEGAGAISSWHLEILPENNEIDLAGVSDVLMHVHYTALDGGDAFKQAVQADNASNLPTTGVKILSAQNDFPAPPPSQTNQFPLTPWWSFFSPAPGADQTLVLPISPASFPNWTRGKTITVTGLTVMAVSWRGGNFVLQPQAPLPTTNVNLTPVAGVTEPNVVSGTVAIPPGTPLGIWTFKLRAASAGDFHSLGPNSLGDVLLLINFTAS